MLACANLVMTAVMTMAPLRLEQFEGDLGAIGLVASAHIAGMFAPSPLSGWLTDRYSPRRTAALSGAAMVISSLMAAAAVNVVSMTIAMMLLGVGWNLALLSGSQLLVHGVHGETRPRRQAHGEVAMGLAAFVGAVSSGLLMNVGGYAMLSIIAACVSSALIVLSSPIPDGKQQ